MSTAAHHGMPSPIIHSAITAPIAAVYPAARSISPSSSTKISAMPSVMMNAACSMRLTKLRGVMNTGLLTQKKMTMAIRPTMTGRAPLSPLRTRRTQIRA